MARDKKAKKSKGIGVLIIALVALAAVAYLMLYNNGVVVKKTDSTDVVNKLKYIKLKGGEFELNQKDVDELSNLYFAKPINKGGIILKGVNIEILKDELLIQTPIRYKNLNLLLTSTGKINLSDGKVSYVPNDFKIGKLKLPKNFVITRISKLNNKNFSVEDNLIIINPNVLPFKINSLKVEDNKILGTAEKMDIKKFIEDITKTSGAEVDTQLAALEQKIQSNITSLNQVQKEKVMQIQKTIEAVKNKSIEEKKKVLSDIMSMLD